MGRVDRLVISILCVFLSSILCFSQKSPDFVDEKISSLYDKPTPNAEETFRIGSQILKLSTTPAEFTIAYSRMADGLYKKEEYSRALPYYKKVDSLAIILKNHNRRFLTNVFITGIYCKVGLPVRAKESFNEVKRLALVTDQDYPSDYYIIQLEAFLQENDSNYCDAITTRGKQVKYEEQTYKDTDIRKGMLVYSYSHLAHNYLKCNQAKNADRYLKKIDSLLLKNSTLANSIHIAFFEMTKAIYAAESGESGKSKFLFEKALSNARNNNLNTQRMQILEEQIKYNNDDLPALKILIKEWDVLNKKKKQESLKIIEGEEVNKNNTIKRKENYIMLLVAISAVFALCILILIKINQRRKKRLHIKFNQIIEDIRKQNAAKMNDGNEIKEEADIAIETVTTNNDIKDKNRKRERIMSGEKETELLSKLLKIEEEKVFLEKNFTVSTMASLLETNSWYINILLQNHRGKSFNDYINHKRIEYITTLLYNDPKYLNYKISYLSNLCGYSSHSRFTQIFKKEAGISPSQFITELSKKVNPIPNET